MRLRTALVLLASLMALGCAKAPPRQVNLLLPRIGSQGLALTVGEGSVQVLPSGDGTVHVDVKLERPRWLFGYWTTAGKAEALNGATLTQQLDNQTRSVSLAFPAGSDGGGIQQVWVVQLPPIMHLKVAMNAGKLGIGGVAGGVDVDLRAGALDLDIPYGPLQAVLGAGDIEARTHVLDYGPILLQSDSGEAQLTINGSAAGNTQRTGAGQRVDFKGTGTNAINLSSGAGKVTLSLSEH